MANYYRTQAGNLLDAYWTNDSGTPVGTLLSFNYVSTDNLYLSEWNSTTPHNITITSDPYPVLGAMGLVSTASTGKVIISSNISANSTINFQCDVEIVGGTAETPLNVCLSYDNSLGYSLTIPVDTHCKLNVNTATLNSIISEAIINDGHITELIISNISWTSGTYGVLSNNGMVDYMSYPTSSLGTNEFGSSLTMIYNSGLISWLDCGAVGGNLAGIFLYNEGQIGSFTYAGGEVKSATNHTDFTLLDNDYAGIIDSIVNSSTFSCEPYYASVFINNGIIYDWIDYFYFNIAGTTISVLNNGTIVHFSGTIVDNTSGNYNGFLNTGTCEQLELTIDESNSTAGSYATFSNSGKVNVANITTTYSNSGQGTAIVNADTIYELTMSVVNSGSLQLKNNGTIYIWITDISSIMSPWSIYTGIIYNIINPFQVLDNTKVKSGTEMLYQVVALPDSLKTKYTGTASSTDLGPWDINSKNIGPFPVGPSNVGPYPVK